jgi:paraquat-inducible protein A
MPAVTQPLKVGVTDPPGATFMLVLYRGFAVDEAVCPRCQTKGTARRKHSLQWTLACW